MSEYDTIVKRVVDKPVETAVLEPAVIGADTLVLDWTVDIEETGGWLLIGDVEYEYDAAVFDEDAGTVTVTLTAGSELAVDVEADETVTLLSGPGAPMIEWVVVVPTEDPDAPEDEATIPTSLIGFFTPAGDDLAGALVRVRETEEGLEVLTRPDEPGTFNAEYVDPGTLPEPALPGPPEFSPAPVTESVPSAVSVKWEWDNRILYQLHVAVTEARTATPPGPDTLHTDPARPTWVSTDPTGALLPAEGAWFAIVAYNSHGAADPSAWVPGVPAQIPEAYAAGILAPSVLARIIKGETIEGVNLVGVTLDILGSLYAEPGYIEVTANWLKALAIEVSNLRVTGQNNAIEGGLDLASGTSAPGIEPSVSTSWSHAAATLEPADETGVRFNPRGLWWDSTRWVFTETLFDGKPWSINTTTSPGEQVVLASTFGPDFQPLGGITRIGTDWFVLGRIGTEWRVYRFDATWTKTGDWLFIATASISGSPAITSDGANLIIAYRLLAGGTQLRAATYSTTGAVVRYDILDNSWGTEVRGVYYGPADYGVNRFVVASANGVRVYTTGGASGTTQNRPAGTAFTPAGGEEIVGLGWDGDRFHTLTPAGRVWHYSKQTETAEHGFSFAWYDLTDPDHITEPGPAVTYEVPARTWTKVQTGTPADAGGDDDPNAVLVYVDNHRQPDLPEMVNVAIYDEFDLLGDPGETTNGFETVNGSIGALRSGAEDGIGRVIELVGTGEWRLGHLRGNADGTNYHDTGWLDITPGAGYAHSPGDTAQVRQIDGKLYWRGALRRGSVVGAGTAAGTLPAEITLSAGLATMIRTGNQWIPWIIAASGSLTISSAVVTGQDINVASAGGANGMLV